MWPFYILAAMLAASVVIKLTLTLSNRGRNRNDRVVTKGDSRLGAFLTVFIPLAALLVYLPLGRPDLEGAPALFSDPEGLIERQQALLQRHPYQILLEQNPEDLGSLVKLASIAARLGDYKQSAKFYQRAVVEAQKTNDTLLRIYVSNLGEVQVMAGNGTVGDDAVGTFEYLRTLYPESPLARYYLALSKAQHGDGATAMAEWEALLSDGAPGAYWKEEVRDAMAHTRAEMAKAPAKK